MIAITKKDLDEAMEAAREYFKTKDSKFLIEDYKITCHNEIFRLRFFSGLMTFYWEITEIRSGAPD